MDAPTLNSDQQQGISSPAAFLRVSGPAGTGKTFVLMCRAQRKAEEERAKRTGGQVLMFCYNKTLAKYAQDLMRQNGVPSTVQTTTFHSWASQQLKRHGVPLNVIEGHDQDNLIMEVLSDCRHDGVRSLLLGRTVAWWREEIYWIKGQLVEDWEMYRHVARIGRGAQLPEGARKVVWQVYTRYTHVMEEHGAVDYPDFARKLLAIWSSMPHRPRVAHVLVDEAQDLRFAELRVLKLLACDSFTAAVDRRQKIYRTSFAWKDLEEGTPAAYVVLKLSYRTTRPVAELSSCLHLEDTLVRPGDDDYAAAPLPDKPGPMPVLIAVPDARQEEAMMLRLIDWISQEHGGRPLGLLARQWSILVQAEHALVRNDIPHERIQGSAGSVVTPGVKLTTFHSAKGLEFADVIIIGLTEGLFPPPVGSEVATEEGEQADDFLGTERRLLYVAMTRTRRGLYMLHRPKSSRFLQELDPKFYTTTVPELAETAPAARQSSLAGTTKVPF